jgi:hypothetical protein
MKVNTRGMKKKNINIKLYGIDSKPTDGFSFKNFIILIFNEE